MGAEFIIAVNVLPDIGGVDKSYWTGVEVRESFKESNIIEILLQSVYIGANQLMKTALKSADLVIEPQLVSIGPGDFQHARECILQGKLATEDCIPKYKRLLSSAQFPPKKCFRFRDEWGFS